MGVQPELLGASDVAGRFAGGAQVLRIAWLDGDPGAVWMHQGDVRVAFAFKIRDGVIQEIWLRSDPHYLTTTDLELEPAERRRSVGG
jgi:RNA polymerase sigma-70 factor (ECF subfamily)